MCGEKAAVLPPLEPPQGSPPRVRGKAERVNMPRRFRRITPAYAGKSIQGSGPLNPAWDHPRVCGEKGFIGLEVGLYPGSPPRMRGKALGDGSFLADKGITPAYAGKSGRHQKRTAWEEDHPRVCGEKIAPLTTSPVS